jgi:plastocyanin
MMRQERMLRTLGLAVILSAGLGLATTAWAAQHHIILVKKWDVVDPDTLTIARGDEVLWLNPSGEGVMLIFERKPGAAETPLVIFTQFSARFDQAGTYRYMVTGMSGPRGASLPSPAIRPRAVPAAAGSGMGWIIVR